MGMSSKQALRQDNINNWANKYLKELINNFDKLDENGKYFLFKNLKEYEQLSKDPKKVVIEFGTNVVLPNIEITEKVKTFIKSKPKLIKSKSSIFFVPNPQISIESLSMIFCNESINLSESIIEFLLLIMLMISFDFM
jgi:hypothetical protein